MPFINESYRDSFFKYVELIPEHICHEWTAGKDKDGYGSFSFQHSITKKHIHRGAHRIAYFFHYGNYNDALCVCHTCDNPGCVNPKHLFLATGPENTADKVRKNRQARGYILMRHRRHPTGERNGNRALTEDDVKKIRAKYIPYEKGAHCIAKEFGVSKPTILAIVKNKTWKHI